MLKTRLGLLALAVAIATAASPTSAATFQYGFGLNNATANAAPANGVAQVDFELSGSDLIVTLTNLSNVTTGNGSEITAVYWNAATNLGSFSSVTLNTANNSSVLYQGGSYTSGDHLNGNAGGGGAGWYAYSNALNLDSGQQFGLSSAGLGLNYTSDYLSLKGETAPVAGYTPAGPDGPSGGLVGTDGVTHNLFNNAVVSNSVIFKISGVGYNFNLGSIEDVQFQYMTTRIETNAVPLPAAAWMGLSTLVGGALLRLRKRARKA